MIALAVLIAYVLGSIPTGLWLGLRLKGVDIRQHGSKNIGATNTLRVLGKALGAVALAGDLGKGVIAVVLVARLSDWPHAATACGLTAIVGHTLSVFLRFRGGKGVATSAGVFLGLALTPTLIALAVFLAMLAATRMVSAASMSGALAMIVAVFILSDDLILQSIATVAALLIIVRHRSNISRILSGQEPRLGEAKNREKETP